VPQSGEQWPLVPGEVWTAEERAEVEADPFLRELL
jgi:hypothetical protein